MKKIVKKIMKHISIIVFLIGVILPIGSYADQFDDASSSMMKNQDKIIIGTVAIFATTAIIITYMRRKKYPNHVTVISTPNYAAR